jgi:anti-sigma B factor antagonist
VFSSAAVDLSLETEVVGPEEYVIAVAGEVDLYTCPEFKEELLRVADEGAVHVVVDLTQTTFIDSTGLGVLLRGVERLRRREDGRLSVVCTDANMRRLFEITGLDRIFGVYASRSQAFAAAASA